MATLLLLIIFASFIGLGLPDSVFGASWPAIYTELGVSYSYANLVTFLTSIGSATASIFSVKIIQKIGTGKTAVISNLLCAVAILGISFSEEILFIVLLSVPLGLGAGAIDSALNNYVALNYKSSQMSFLHAFYGLGITASPFLMFLAINGLDSWRIGYRLVFYILLGISVLTVIALPLWGKVSKSRLNESENNAEVKQAEPETDYFGFKNAVKMPAVRVLCLAFFSSVGIEFVLNGWGSTYFFNVKNLGKDFAALVMTFYYLGMTLGRFLSGLITKKIAPMTVVKIGQIIVGVGIVLVLLPLNYIFSVVGIALIGLGNGPFFPNLTYLTPINFGRNKSQAVISAQMFSSTFGGAVAPVLFGLIAHFNVALLPVFILVLWLIVVTVLIVFSKKHLPKLLAEKTMESRCFSDNDLKD